jgi:hypothetical protein
VSKDPFSPSVSLLDFEPPAVKRAAPAPEFRRPRRVQLAALRANQLIAAFARGGNAGVRAILTAEELEARAIQERIIGSPEKVVTKEAFAELAAGIEAGGPAAVIPPEDELARRERAKLHGRKTPDDTQ